MKIGMRTEDKKKKKSDHIFNKYHNAFYIKFAWLPVRLDCGIWIWLESYLQLYHTIESNRYYSLDKFSCTKFRLGMFDVEDYKSGSLKYYVDRYSIFVDGEKIPFKDYKPTGVENG